jgi:hypothetical protein
MTGSVRLIERNVSAAVNSPNPSELREGKHITKHLRVSHEEREILNVRLFNGKRLGDELVECYRAQMRAGWDGKWVEIAGVSLSHYAWTGPDDPRREETMDAHMGILGP